MRSHSNMRMTRSTVQYTHSRMSKVRSTLLVALLCASPPLFAEWTLFDGARVHPEYHGTVPNKSDVVFTTRSNRPDALNAINAFGATRVEWCYSDDTKFIRQVRGLVNWFGGAINPTITPAGEGGQALDIEGSKVVAPWMKPWGHPWITTTSENSRITLLEKSTSFIDAGANSIQVDDPLMQFGTLRWGGDFSSETIGGFSKYILEHPEKAGALLASTNKKSPIDYKKYLAKIVALTKQVSNPATSSGYPRTMNSKAKRALFDNLNRDEKLATDLDAEILRTRQDGWIDNKQKRKMVRNAIAKFITDENEIDRIFELVKNQSEYKRSATDNN